MSRRLNKDGLLRSSPATIFTYGGGTIEPLDPDPEDITLEAIAHALSHQCRWTGHTLKFYSVAEHSVLVSEMEPSLEALLHDASEAYLADLARPIKKAAGLGEVYLEVEAKLERAIAERFTLAWPMSKAVAFADDALLKQEAKTLVPHLGELMPDPPEGTPAIHCWTPRSAERAFVRRFKELGGVELGGST